MLLVLGGGMAGLTAACRAAELGQEVTVVQRGHLLGGKGASHRTTDGRIEEHGLHIWPGYYDNAFALLRRIHGSEDDALPGLFPAPAIGVADEAGAPWMARFSTNDRRPGIDVGQLTVSDFVRQCAELLADLVRSSTSAQETSVHQPHVYLSGSSRPRTKRGSGSPLRLVAELVNTLITSSVTHLPRVLQSVPATSPQVTTLLDEIQRAASDLGRRRDGKVSQIDQVIDLVVTSLLGIYRDGLLTDPAGFAAINDLDFREWLTKHRAHPAAVDSAVVRGMYDLTFAYRQGEASQPAFEAGTGLMLAGRFFFDFKGAMFWKMNAGMGETIFAPLYQHLKTLGVEFRFFHRVENVGIDPSTNNVETIEIHREATVTAGITEYEPLVKMGGMHVFPEHPIADQLTDSSEEDQRIVLKRGVHFDNVILATSLGMVPLVCQEILERDHRWQDMVENVAVVATQALQLWAKPTEAELGWNYPGSTVAGYNTRFDTYASMSHLIEVESTGRPTGSISYFCSALPDADAANGPQAARAATRSNAEVFLNEEIGQLWPDATGVEGFDWGVLVADGTGPNRLDDQYYAANTDPSDRYVQSVPGSGKFRLRADDSGFENLFLAGDWIDSGLNAGCIEAATIAGLQAANAASGRPLCEGVVGGWKPLQNRREHEHT